MDIINLKNDKTVFSKLQSLENILNFSVCKLNEGNHKFWSSLAKRDVKYKEISPNGVQSTKFDLKMEIAKFKKARDKIYHASKI